MDEAQDGFGKVVVFPGVQASLVGQGHAPLEEGGRVGEGEALQVHHPEVGEVHPLHEAAGAEGGEGLRGVAAGEAHGVLPLPPGEGGPQVREVLEGLLGGLQAA